MHPALPSGLADRSAVRGMTDLQVWGGTARPYLSGFSLAPRLGIDRWIARSLSSY
jgi:hypothetical protein